MHSKDSPLHDDDSSAAPAPASVPASAHDSTRDHAQAPRPTDVQEPHATSRTSTSSANLLPRLDTRLHHRPFIESADDYAPAPSLTGVAGSSSTSCTPKANPSPPATASSHSQSQSQSHTTAILASKGIRNRSPTQSVPPTFEYSTTPVQSRRPFTNVLTPTPSQTSFHIDHSPSSSSPYGGSGSNTGHMQHPNNHRGRGSVAYSNGHAPSSNGVHSQHAGVGVGVGVGVGGSNISKLSSARRRRDSSTRRSLPKILLSTTRRSSHLLVRSLGFVVVVLLLYLLFAERRPRIKPDALKTRWWEADSPEKDQLDRLLPKPTMLPKPPRPKPVADLSHSLQQLQRLESNFQSDSPPEWTAIVHVTTAAQYPVLSTLVPSLLAQSNAPTRVLIFVPKGLTPPLGSFGPAVSLHSYPPAQPTVVALLQSLVPSLTTDLLLFVDGHLDALHPNYVSQLMHAAGTKHYSSALLSAGGLILPVSLDSPPTRCVLGGASSARQVDDQLHLQRSMRVHVPGSPFLVQTSWMTTLSNGIRTDVPMEAAIALALWTKTGIPAYALPIPVVPGGSSGPHSSAPRVGSATVGCERIKRALQGVGSDRRIGPSFRPEAGGGGDLGPAVAQAYASSSLKKNGKVLDPSAAGRRFARDLGAIVILLSGEDELDKTSILACGLAQENDVRVYVADLPNGKRAGGRRVLYDDAESGAHCHLDVRPLGSGHEGESVSLAVLDEMDKVGKVAVAIYLTDGHRGREFDEVMKWNRGVFGRGRGGRRRSRKEMEDEKGTVIISLDKNEIQLADWIAALPLDALRHWHTPRIDVSLVTNNRPASLHRLLSALQTAHYFGDEVSLYMNLEQTADAVTSRLVSDFDWPYGTVTVRHRIILGGLMPAIVESWYPASNDTYGVFLEDDVEVSPLYYGWLKLTILYYRYSIAMRDQSARLFGISMYQQKFIELRPEGRQPFDAHVLFDSLALDPTLPYLSQIPCSWGAVYFPEIWREFHTYLALRLSEMAMPISDQIVPEIRSNKWPRSWKKYIIELIYLRGYVMLYPNYPNFTSLSTNHLEVGTHVKSAFDIGSKPKMQFTVPLMQRDESLLALPSGRLPSFDTLPIIDLWGMLATDEDIIERGWQTTAQLDSCPVPFRLDTPPTYNARELLCTKDYERVERYYDTQPLAATLKEQRAQREQEAQRILREREAAANARIAAALAREDNEFAAAAALAARERPAMVAHPDREDRVAHYDESRRGAVLRQPGESEEAHRLEQERVIARLAAAAKAARKSEDDDLGRAAPVAVEVEVEVEDEEEEGPDAAEPGSEPEVEPVDVEGEQLLDVVVSDTEPIDAVDAVPEGDEAYVVENGENDDDVDDDDDGPRRRKWSGIESELETDVPE